MRKFLSLLLSGSLLCLSCPRAIADTQYYSTPTSDGKYLGLDLADTPVQYDSWTVFRYSVKDKKGNVIKRIAATPFCDDILTNRFKYLGSRRVSNLVMPKWIKSHNDKGNFYALANYAMSSGVGRDPFFGWITVVNNNVVKVDADTKLSEFLMRNVCYLSISTLD